MEHLTGHVKSSLFGADKNKKTEPLKRKFQFKTTPQPITSCQDKENKNPNNPTENQVIQQRPHTNKNSKKTTTPSATCTSSTKGKADTKLRQPKTKTKETTIIKPSTSGHNEQEEKQNSKTSSTNSENQNNTMQYSSPDLYDSLSEDENVFVEGKIILIIDTIT